MQVRLGTKRGKGVGAAVEVLAQENETPIGALTFCEGNRWVIGANRDPERFNAEVFRSAVTQAREAYPQG